MDSVSFHATSKLEDKLSGIYEILYKKESKIAGNINRYTATPKSNDVVSVLFLHLSANICVIGVLFHLLY